jgi:hypothetical protein
MYEKSNFTIDPVINDLSHGFSEIRSPVRNYKDNSD